MEVIDPLLVTRQLILVAVNSRDIFRGRQNAPDDCLAQGHFRCDMTFKQFCGHIAVIIQIAHVGGRQTQQLSRRAQLQQFFYSFSPIFNACTMKFIQNDIDRLLCRNFFQLLIGAAHQLCVGVKSYVCK